MVIGSARGAVAAAGGGALVVIGWLAGAGALPPSYLPVAAVLAEVLAVLALGVGWRFRRSRLVVAAVLIAVANVILRTGAAGGLQPGEHALLGVLLPLNLAVVGLCRDRAVISVAAGVHLAVVLLQPGLVRIGLEVGDSVDGWLRLLQAPEAALFATLVAAVFVALALALRRGMFEAGLLWVLLAGLLAVQRPERAATLLAAAQLCLLLAVVEDSYRLAFHDELTGLPSRRSFNDALRTLDGTYSLAMVDVDRFKRFNDRWGHDAGDQVLRMVAEELRRVGGGGRSFRYGGEEFAVVFAGRSPAEALEPCEALRRAIEARPFAIRAADRPRSKPRRARSRRAAPRAKLTVSVGIAGPNRRRPSPAEVLRAADRALYRAKNRGRNRVVKA
jgi:diguanylate cyclase (GGDEF)-like protein